MHGRVGLPAPIAWLALCAFAEDGPRRDSADHVAHRRIGSPPRNWLHARRLADRPELFRPAADYAIVYAIVGDAPPASKAATR
jgi:hypothetical protein